MSETKPVETPLNKPSGRVLIIKEIGIDAGHRVTNHGSKCKSPHGHRYQIFATVSGPLYEEGEQEGMVLDFSFLKEEMTRIIDGGFDHGMILWRRDPLVIQTLSNEELTEVDEYLSVWPVAFLSRSKFWGKVAITKTVPTAENLAQLWYELLAPRILKRTDDRATLVKVEVYETPTSSAIYMP